jgi:glycosyltransferase involved in cell wall biosynthesis
MLVSVVIPCFNVEAYIEECVDSVYGQTHKHFEVICIDNNSTDDTWVRLVSLQIKHPSLVIEKEYKKGACAARNKGFSLAAGTWIQFLDADDLLLPTKIEHQLGIVKNGEGFVVANLVDLFVNGKKMQRSYESSPWTALFRTTLGYTSGNLWHKGTLLKVGGWNENLISSQEYDLMFRCLKSKADIYFDDIALTVRRERESGQISKYNPKGKWERYLNLRLEILDYLKGEEPDEFEKLKDLIHQSLFSILRVLSPYNWELTYTTYKNYLPSDFVPSVNFKPTVSYYNSATYVKLYELVGFRFTEYIKKTLSFFRK